MRPRLLTAAEEAAVERFRAVTTEIASNRGGYPQSFIYGPESRQGRAQRLSQREVGTEPLVLVIERHDGLYVELDADDRDHGERLAKNWIETMQVGRSAALWSVNDNGKLGRHPLALFDWRDWAPDDGEG